MKGKFVVEVSDSNADESSFTFDTYAEAKEKMTWLLEQSVLWVIISVVLDFQSNT